MKADGCQNSSRTWKAFRKFINYAHPTVISGSTIFNAFCMQFITIIVSMLSFLPFFFSTSMYAYTETHILFLFPINNSNPDKKNLWLLFVYGKYGENCVEFSECKYFFPVHNLTARNRFCDTSAQL